MKRYVKTNSEYDGVRSVMIFDFPHDGYYSQDAIYDAVQEAMDFCGYYLEYVEFEDLGSAAYPDVDGMVSQCICRFVHDGHYDANRLSNAIELTISHLNADDCGEVLNVDFETD